MKKNILLLLVFTLINCSSSTLLAQGIKMSERMIISHPVLKKDISPDAFQSYLVNNLSSAWNKVHPKESIHSFRADRGAGKDQFLIACGIKTTNSQPSLFKSNPFNDAALTKNKASKLADFISNPESFTEYRLIGANQFKSLPTAGILGIHYIQVKPDRAAEFEKFIIDKLHPAVGHLLPDMQLFYYKAVAGEPSLQADNTYITIFTIESPDARHKYWPAGAPETDILKQAFKPLNGLASELGSYLVEGSYLLPENGAAAYFESRRWTDFIHQSFLK